MNRILYMGLFGLLFVLALFVTPHIDSGLSLLAQTPETTAPGDTPPPAASEGDAPVTQGFFQIIFSGGWIGFAIVMFLFALSLTAAYLVFEQIMSLRKSEIVPDGLSDQVRALLSKGMVKDAATLCRERPTLLSFVIAAGLAEAESGWTASEKALEDALAEQSARLLRKVEYLAVIGNIAPMVGLLGTVVGMIFAFQKVAGSQGAAGAGELAEGIYQALVTTVGGLLVAIPSLGAFAIFRNRVDGLVAEAAYAAQHALAPLKRQRTVAPRATPRAVTAGPESGPLPPPVQGG